MILSICIAHLLIVTDSMILVIMATIVIPAITTPCLLLHPPTSTCLSCRPPQLLTQQGTCLSSSIPNCEVLTAHAQTCEQCQVGYRRDRKGQCEVGDEGCLVYDEYTCIQCQDGMQVEDGICTGVRYCHTYIGEECIQCLKGIQLKNGRCYRSERKIQFCSQYSSHQSQQCVQCMEGTKLVNHMCIPHENMVPMCRQYNHVYQCVQCQFFFQIFSNSQGVRSCAIGDIKTKKRRPGQFRILQENSPLTSSIEHCVDFDRQFCWECETGYTNLGFLCEKSSVAIGCVAYNFMDRECMLCSEYFSLQNGSCIDLQCQEVDPVSGLCLECNKEYGAQVFFNGEFCEDRNCESTEDGVCSECKQGYYLKQISPLKDTGCLKIKEENCLKYTSPECQQCGNQHYFSLSQQACREIRMGCMEMDLTKQTCQTCHEGLILDGDTCSNPYCLNTNQFPCSQCRWGFIPQDGRCVDPHCLMLADTLKCGQCRPGFRVIEERCSDEKCMDIFQNGSCVECMEGYSLLSDVCMEVQGDIDNETIDGIENETQANLDNEQMENETLQIDPSAQQNKGQAQQKTEQQREVESLQSGGSLTEQSEESEVVIIPNCQEIQDNLCQWCQERYYLSQNQKSCIEIQSDCESYVMATGLCIACYNRIEPISGNCSDPYCIQLDGSDCLECQTGYFVNQSTGLCQFELENCLRVSQSWLQSCMECQKGYSLNYMSHCMEIPPHCSFLNYITSQCISCSQGYTLSALNLCELIHVDQQCEVFSNINLKICLICQHGYRVSFNGTCEEFEMGLCAEWRLGGCRKCVENYVLEEVSGVCYDVNCWKWGHHACIECKPDFYSMISEDGYAYCQQRQKDAYIDRNCQVVQNGTCAQCSNRYYFSEESQKCSAVDSLCREYQPKTGKCTSCYPYYEISSDGRCTVIVRQDPFCSQYLSASSKCESCFKGYFINATTTLCQKIDPLCRNYNETSGQCYDCFQGYSLVNQKCQISLTDPYCLRKSIDGKVCEKCAPWFYFSISKSKCEQVSPLCRTYDNATGSCTQCYPRYEVVEGACTPIIKATEDDKKLQYCKRFSTSYILVRTCEECYKGYFVKNGVCETINPLCKTTDVEGLCTSCYSGYLLSGGSCSLPSAQADPFCQERSADNKSCQRCLSDYIYTSSFLKCVPNLPTCAVVLEQSQQCMDCHEGFRLKEGNCILAENSDVHCVQRDRVLLNEEGEGICRGCASGYYLSNSTQKCSLINQLCRGVNMQNGDCLGCYPGYELVRGQCIDPREQIASSPYCQSYNYQLSLCQQCIDRYYLSNGQCEGVPITCSTFNSSTGQCLSCVSELYDLQNGECVQLLSRVQGCLRYSGPYCAECEPGYIFTVYTCVKEDPNCVKLNPEKTQCEVCRDGKIAKGLGCF